MKPENIKITPKWSKNKEDIWNETFAALEDSGSSRINRIPFWKFAAAVVILIVLTGTITARFYSVTETTARGTHLTVTLPDGSTVNLNAESKLTYRPYWWLVSRMVELNGEAYFEVTQGKRFSVISNQNEVKVLGTSFNVFARTEKYCVTCLTGKVEVTAANETVLLNPDMRLTYRGKKMTLEENIDATQSNEWTKDKFVFVGVPLVDVVREIERQYDIRVKANNSLDHFYTGNFSKTEKPDEILEIIGKPFGIKFSIK